MFESEFLKETERLYEQEGRVKCLELEVPAYLRHINRRLEEETNRLHFYLDFNTRKPLIAVTEKTLIAEHVDAILVKGKFSKFFFHVT